MVETPRFPRPAEIAILPTGQRLQMSAAFARYLDQFVANLNETAATVSIAVDLAPRHMPFIHPRDLSPRAGPEAMSADLSPITRPSMISEGLAPL